MSGPARTFILIRQDIPLAWQLVQGCHAALQGGARFAQPEYSHLVLCGLADSVALHDAAAMLDEAAIPYYLFYEPDMPGAQDAEHPTCGHTALCTAPVTGAARMLFRKFPLWSPPD